jgi:LysM repeat protein
MAITFASSPGRTSVPFHVHLPSAGSSTRPLARSTYVRRRVGALTFVVALVLSVGSVAQHGLADRGDDPASVSAIGRSVTYVVQPGDTMWSIAEQLYPGSDIALVVDSLVSLNGGTAIDVGQRVLLP